MSSRRCIRPSILLAIVALALVACDPASFPFLVILQVQSVGDSVYAYAVRRYGGGLMCCPYGDPAFYSSQDSGHTWIEIAAPPPELEQKLQEACARSHQVCDRELRAQCTRIDGLGRVQTSGVGARAWYENEGARYPFVDKERELAYKSLDYRPICSKTTPSVCFRLGEQGQIERSLDGGTNWRMDWQLPHGRQAFLVRSAAYSRRRIPTDTRPLDLAVLDTADGMSVIAALGNQGVMVRTPQGLWERRSVDDARPLPYQAESLGEAFKTVSPEAALSAMIACLFSLFLSGTTRVALRSLAQETEKTRLRPWLPACVGLVLVILILILAQKIVASGITEIIPVPCSLTFFLGVMVFTWVAVSKAAKERGWLWIARMTALTSPSILFTVTFLPYFLWALGTIATQEVAASSSASLGSLVAVLCLAYTIRSAARAARMS